LSIYRFFDCFDFWSFYSKPFPTKLQNSILLAFNRRAWPKNNTFSRRSGLVTDNYRVKKRNIVMHTVCRNIPQWLFDCIRGPN